MSDLDKSIASLVKYNNGQFKSEKQANLFHSKAVDGVYYSSGGSMYGNTFRNAYVLGPNGVKKVVKMLGKGKQKTVWTPDKTDGWKKSNDLRAERKELAAWINKATAVLNKYDKVVDFAMSKDKQHLVMGRAGRIKELQSQIEQAHQKLQDLQSSK